MPRLSMPKGGGDVSDAKAHPHPPLPTVQTDDHRHSTGHADLSLEEETAVLQSMSLESPPGLVQSPTSLSTMSMIQSPTLTSTPTTPTTPHSPASATSSASPSKFVSALQDVRHFAGGLISHPYESTRHYSILRHSMGIVYYSGSSTNVAITIFSDQELPSDRTLWLQRRGFSGKTGLKIGGLLGARSTWIDITPATRATSAQVSPDDERAFQRDIKKFLRKAAKQIQSHRVRETDILRIPCEAEDGYLRVVLCTGGGKKTLCGSPIFRLASSSTDSSVIRGSSLTSMPLEAGIKFASVFANQFVTATAGPYVETVRSAITSQVSSIYQPSLLTREAMTAAYDQSGVQARIDTMNEQYGSRRDESFNQLELTSYDALNRPSVIGPESGPVAPFPVQFHGTVVAGTGRSMAMLKVPTANLTNVPEDILLRHKGFFFGWAAVTLPKKLAAETTLNGEWHQAIVMISPDPDRRRTVTHRNSARVYIIHDFQSVSFVDAKLSVLMMGYLRASEEFRNEDQEPDVEALMFDFYKDVATANASLARPGWSAKATLERMKSVQSSRSIGERYVDLRQTTQRQIDRVPVHRLGLRTDGMALRDRLIGNGGVCIQRQEPIYRATA